MIYFFSSLIVFIKREKYSVSDFKIDGAKTAGLELSLSRDENWAIAATFTGPNINSGSQVDLDIGELKYYLKSWDETDTNPKFTALKTRLCTRNDLIT